VAVSSHPRRTMLASFSSRPVPPPCRALCFHGT
jgi:hypothetical protein